MTRISRLLLVAMAAALASPALAHAEERTLTFTTPAISVEGYGVAQQPMLAESPKVDGYVVGMEAEVVDAQGRVQGRDKVMLHHIVFAKVGVPDYTCGGAAERFFAEGEERLALSLPRGYGYAEQGDRPLGPALHADEPQAAAAERLHPLHGALRDRRDADAGEADLARHPELHRPGSRLRRPRRRPDVLDLHEVGRLHDAAERPARLGRRPPPRRRHPGRAAQRDLRDEAVRVAPDLGRPEAETAPARARPDEDVLVPLGDGDPGREGRPAPARRRLRQLGAAHAGDGDHAPLPRAGSGRRLRRDAGARRRSRPAVRPARLLDAVAAGAERQGLAATSTVVGDFQYGAERVVLKRGATFTWRFMGSVQHDVTVVGGPVGFSAPWTQSGVFTHRFTKAGTYRLFCSLHPSKMVQQITVR